MKPPPAKIVRRLFFVLMIGPLLFLATRAPAQTAEFFETNIFTSGADGYAYYRIPSIVQANNGTLLAFAEGRKNDRSDSGDIDLVLRRSYDNGQTWDAMQIVWSNSTGVAGNPCPIVDQTTGDILLVSNHQTPGATQTTIRDGTFGERTYHVQRSSDSGATWTDPVRIAATDALSPRWMAGGPNHGIQLVRGDHPGRLVLSGNHSVGADYDTNRAHVIYSDDGGTTWSVGAVSGYSTDIYVSETAPVELLDGSLYFTTRDQNGPSVGNRAYATSQDAGESFAGPFQIDSTAVAPVCQGSILRYSSTDQGDSRNRVIQSYPYSSSARENIMVRSSFNEAATWNSGRVIYEGSSAYSDLVRTANDRIGLLYERDTYATITFASFTPGWLDDAPDLKLYSSMDNMNTTSGVVFDDFGGHNGQLMGSATQVIDATRGKVLEITGPVDTGSTNYVTYGDVLDPVEASYTVSYWFKLDSDGASRIMASKGCNYSTADGGWATTYGANDGAVFFRASYGDDDHKLGLKKTIDREAFFGEWHHLVAVIDQEEGVIKAYLDGVGSYDGSGLANGWDTITDSYDYAFPTGSIFEDDTSRAAPSNELTIGGTKSGGDPLNGRIDDFAVWNRGLTEAEILGIFNGTLSIPLPDPVPGDANRDYVVNEDDAAVLAANWGHTNVTGGAAAGDFNDDGIVNVLDASILAANWGSHIEAAGPSAVPEPGILAFSLLGGLMLAIGRRRVRQRE
jgi:sialidase-1